MTIITRVSNYISLNILFALVSDGERVKGVRSPTPKGAQSQEHTFIKDDGHHMTEPGDNYIDDMKKGTSNILVNIYFIFL